MKNHLKINLSLHKKLIISMWLMFIPLLLCAIGIFQVAFFMKSSLDELDGIATSDSPAVMQLHLLTSKSVGLVDYYVINGSSDSEKEINLINSNIESEFNRLISNILTGEKSTLLNNAFKEWQNIKNTEQHIISLKQHQYTESAAIIQQNEQLHTQFITFDDNMDRLSALIDSDTYGKYQQASNMRGKIIPVIALIFITSLGIEAVAIVFIMRSLIIPARFLAQAAHHYGEGSFSYRIPLSSNDEMRDLARTFNDMAEKLQISYQNLTDLAIHDGLTGALNHREFKKLLLNEIKRAQRYKHNLALIMIDIDNFKTFNDTYGHQIGDKILKLISDYLLNSTRSSDQVARYGGEEFALIMPETLLETAYATAERIRLGISKILVNVDDQININTTVSIGVASFPDDAVNAEDLIASADKCLYLAKDRGRNRVCKTSDVIV